MQVSELTGAALNWAVALANRQAEFWTTDNYSTQWVLGGPIIEREKLTIEWTGEDWMAFIRHDEEFFGPTPLIAAMRCYVSSKLGDEIEVPEELK